MGGARHQSVVGPPPFPFAATAARVKGGRATHQLGALRCEAGRDDEGGVEVRREDALVRRPIRAEGRGAWVGGLLLREQKGQPLHLPNRRSGQSPR